MTKQLAAIISSIASAVMLSTSASAQLPSPCRGWNLGNTLEPPSGEGTWGPAATQSLINAVADAGFNTVRIPCSWNSNANQSTYAINATYMARVKQVVDWCYARNLHVVINCHWDNGWLENNITDTVNPTINAKMQSYWTQIATTFAGYDNRLLFAGANEPNCDTAAEWATLRSYYNTFISAVRSTGGNNASRWLVVQGPNTNIDLSDQLVSSLPNDSTSGRLAFEVHFYDPYQWTIMPQDESWGKTFYFWGQGYHHATRTDRNASWGEESYVDSQFQKMANKFGNQGVPVIIGEFMAGKRSGLADLTGADFDLHVASRTYFHKYVVDAANSRGLKPIYWDIAGVMFNWSTGALVDSANKNALTGGAALPPPGGGAIANGTYQIVARHSGKAMEAAGLGTANGTQLQQWGYWGGSSQKWQVTKNSDNTYRILGVQSGKSVDINGWSSANGTKVQLWDHSGGNNQKFAITATSGGYYRITPQNATGSCLDVSGYSSADGAAVHLWGWGGAANQQWAFQAP
jgi:endoglucanase